MLKKDKKWGIFFLAPYTISLFVYTIIPIICLAYFSFTEYNLFNPPRFVGLANYTDVLTSPDTWRALRNVGVYALVYISLNVFLACVLGVALNQKLKGMKIFRTIYFVPSLLPWVAVSLIFTGLFNPVYGIINQFLAVLGIGPLQFTFSKSWVEVVSSMAIMAVWKGVGYASLYVLAGLQNISEDVLEAASIDGAGPVTKFFRIIIPMITPTIFMLMIFGLSNSLSVFDSFLVMLGTGGVTSSEYTVMSMLIYNNAFQFNKIGTASALCWVAVAFVFVITLIQTKTEKRWVHYE
ncbi:MAG: sugar ABC transporter permease [Clostridia bacterium]|nr:sugar ABC transporter permease [Clostridia bacterium]